MNSQCRSWCRDEQCERVELHLAHASCPQHACKRSASSKSKRAPWERSAPKALDHSIAKAVSKTYPKHLDAILREVEDDYGTGPTPSALYRAVQRHLAQLVTRGHILKIDLGRTLYAYLRPGSSLVSDVELMREQIENMIDSTTGTA